jgi:sterol desaturase/sphingolipid hydroxylase (fatty acid hydroxylase superfamily)
VIDYVLKINPFFAKFINKILYSWTLLFYIQHRMAHLPYVYEEAHKFHHNFTGSSSFDAHLYGSGMPEEWITLIVDYSLGSYLIPHSFNFYINYINWTNKTGHTETENDTQGRNRHAYHHVYHNQNFGIYNILLDTLFDTLYDTKE